MKENISCPIREAVRLVLILSILFLPISTVCAQRRVIRIPGPDLAFDAVQFVSGEGGDAASTYGSPVPGAAAVKHKWNTTYSSRFTVSGLASETDATNGNCTLYDNGTFNYHEDEHGMDRNYTGTYVDSGTTGNKIQCILDSNGLQEYTNMLRRWTRDMAREKGVVSRNISLSFTSVRTSKVIISKTTGIPGKAKVALKGTINAYFDGTYTTRKFVFATQITFESAPEQYTLSVLKSGTGSGMVTGTGITCGSDCSEAFPGGTSVTLTAAASSGSSFTGWSGCDSTSGTTCTVTMTRNTTATAAFTASPPSCTLSVNKSGAGSGMVTGTGITCGSDCSEAFPGGTSVTLTAAASSGSSFSGWSGCDSASGTTCTVTMTQSRTVTATFAPNYTLTIQKSGIGSGTIISSPPGINCGGVCSGNYASGTQVTLTATPGSGLTFTNWTGCDSINGNTCTVTMTRNRTVNATFIVCTPRDSCHVFAGYNPQTGCVFRDQRTVLDMSPPLQRFSLESPDGRVNLYYDTECFPWVGNYFQGNEPADNYCGPTAGMNLLDWYGAPSTYDHLGDEMNTNDWISTPEALKACLCSCSPCPMCLCPEPSCSAVCTVLSNTFFDVGTPPDDLENTLRRHSRLESSVGYLLFRHRGNPGLETFEYLLAQGNPIVVLIWNGKTLHWALVTGTYDANGTVMVRFANNDDLTWDTFVHQWSFESMNWPVPRLLDNFGIENFVWMHYEKTAILRSGAEYGGGFWMGESLISADGRFRLILQEDSNLCLRKIENDEPIWCAMTNGTGAQVVWMQTNGNLVMRNSANAVVWSSDSYVGPNGSYYLAIQNDGNLVIYNAANNKAIWETDTCCQ